MKADGTLVVGQIGCGSFAQQVDLPNFTDHAKTEVKWCCDVDEAKARSAAERFGVPRVTADAAEVTSDPDVDLIKIATTHEVHLPLVEAAAANGKHVFCEKPMALERVDALRIVRAVRRSGVKLCVGMNRRMAPALNALRRQWTAHNANPTHQPWRFVEVERAPFPEEERTQFLVRIQDESISYRLSHLDPLRGGGEIIGETVHWLDLACWFFAPQVPVEVQAWGSTRFSHGVHVTFSAGDTATITFNCGGTFDYPKELYEVMCKGALFRSLHFVENNYYGVPGLEDETFPLLVDDFPGEGTQGGFAGMMQKQAHMLANLAGSRKEAQGCIGVDKGHRRLLDAFIEAILDNGPSPCDEMAGWVAVLLANLAIQSIELRQTLHVPIDAVTPILM